MTSSPSPNVPKPIQSPEIQAVLPLSGPSSFSSPPTVSTALVWASAPCHLTCFLDPFKVFLLLLRPAANPVPLLHYQIILPAAQV